MARAHDFMVLRITAQFVAEQEAGKTPRLTDYLQRYPQYTEEIVDFVTYYCVAEADLPVTTETMPELSAETKSALDRAWEREYPRAGSKGLNLTTLIDQQHYSLERLAAELDLGTEIVKKLARGQIEVTTIPQELPGHLARILTQSVHTIRLALGMAERTSYVILAEASALYELTPKDSTQQTQQSFRQVISTSPELSLAQRTLWLTILEHENL